MLDHMWEREREREREREMGLWEKKREVDEVSWFRSFILVFTDKIIDRQLILKFVIFQSVILFVKSNGNF